MSSHMGPDWSHGESHTQSHDIHVLHTDVHFSEWHAPVRGTPDYTWSHTVTLVYTIHRSMTEHIPVDKPIQVIQA